MITKAEANYLRPFFLFELAPGNQADRSLGQRWAEFLYKASLAAIDGNQGAAQSYLNQAMMVVNQNAQGFAMIPVYRNQLESVARSIVTHRRSPDVISRSACAEGNCPPKTFYKPKTQIAAEIKAAQQAAAAAEAARQKALVEEAARQQAAAIAAQQAEIARQQAMQRAAAEEAARQQAAQNAALQRAAAEEAARQQAAQQAEMAQQAQAAALLRQQEQAMEAQRAQQAAAAQAAQQAAAQQQQTQQQQAQQQQAQQQQAQQPQTGAPQGQPQAPQEPESTQEPDIVAVEESPNYTKIGIWVVSLGVGGYVVYKTGKYLFGSKKRPNSLDYDDYDD